MINSNLVLRLDATNVQSYPTTGSTWYDLSPYSLNSTLVNNPTFSTISGGTLTFNGTDQYVRIPYNLITRPSSAITFTVWASKSNWDTGVNSRIISSTQSGGWSINTVTGGNLTTLVRVNGVYQTLTYPLSGITSGLHEFTVTFDGQYINLYIDSVVVNTLDYGSVGLITYDANVDTFLGAEAGLPGPDGLYFTGDIKMVLIYRQSLTSGQIINNYNLNYNKFINSP